MLVLSFFSYLEATIFVLCSLGPFFVVYTGTSLTVLHLFRAFITFEEVP